MLVGDSGFGEWKDSGAGSMSKRLGDEIPWDRCTEDLIDGRIVAE